MFFLKWLELNYMNMIFLPRMHGSPDLEPSRSIVFFYSSLNWSIWTCYSPCGWGVEYAHCDPACLRQLKGCPDGSASIRVGLRRHPVYPSQWCRPKTLPTFPNLSCQIPTQVLLHIMVQHVADWVAPFPRIQHYPTCTMWIP